MYAACLYRVIAECYLKMIDFCLNLPWMSIFQV